MDWSEEGIEEDGEPGLRRRGPGERTPSSSPDHEPVRISGSSPPSSPAGLRRPIGSQWGSVSPSSPSSLGSSGRGSGERPVPRSVRTRRAPKAPSDLAATGGAGSSGAGGSGRSYDDGDLDGVEETVALMRVQSARSRLVSPRPDATTTSASITPGRAEEEEEKKVAVEGDFSFPSLEAPPSSSWPVLGKFAAQFLEATMGATAGPRTEGIKKELLVNRRVVDVVGLERWLRKAEALAELAWFTELCPNEKSTAPPLELFESAFRALEAARSDELHRDARRFWIGPVAVPKLFLCPVSEKAMADPVVITSGKTVERSELEKWWNKQNRICPVTGEILQHRIFIPDVLVKRYISRWRAANNISELTTPTDPPAVSPEEEAQFKEATVLIDSPSNSKQDYEAILRLLEQCSSFLHLIGRSPGTIANLACVLPETCLEPYPELDNIILEILAKAASYSPNKEVLGDDRYTIPVLIARALLGPVPTRAKCAQILGLLADNYYNKIKIGELGGFAPLVELLSVGDTDVKKTVAVALASLCEAQENWSRFVREGVADAAISLLRNDNLVDEAHRIFVQAEGFDLGVTDIMDKLGSFRSEKMCKEMEDRLWDTFIRSTPGQRRRPANFAPEPPEASSSSAVSTDDVQAIVSWLQNKAYNPHTFRFSKYHD